MTEATKTAPFKKVMIIDDNEVDRYIATRHLLKYTFAEEVIAKESVNAAVDYLVSAGDIAAELPRIIFLDINMPEKNGFDFLNEFNGLSDTIKNNCTIVMLSTSLNPEDHERALSNKYVKKFLNKPLDKTKLSEILELKALIGA